MKQKYIKVALLLALVSFSPLFSCDTNLFSLIAGNTKENAFIEASTAIAVAAKNLNEHIKSPDVNEKLEALMNQWLSFSNAYLVFPPEWGKNDENWKAKFSDMALSLGEIRQHLGKSNPKTHSAIMKFSRRLSRFYEKMPATPEASLLLAFTYGVDDLWKAFESKDLALINSLAISLESNIATLRKTYEKHDLLPHIDKIEGRIDNLKNYSEKGKAFNNFTFTIIISGLEDDLTKLNESISASLASSTAEVH